MAAHLQLGHVTTRDTPADKALCQRYADETPETLEREFAGHSSMATGRIDGSQPCGMSHESPP